MKICLIILLYFCALQFCNAQKYFNELIDYNTQQSESFTGVVQQKDSSYLCVGFSFKSGVGYNYFSVKTKPSGVMLNKISFIIPNTEINIASPLKAVNDSEFVCTGVITDQDSTTLRYNRDIFLLKLNNIGDTLWTKRLGFGIGTLSNPDFEVGFDVIYTQDNGYAITGYSSNFVGGNVQVCLIKTDSLGNLLWQKSYGGGGTDNAYSLIQTPDKGFLLAGFTYSYGNGDRDGYLIKTDSLGTFQWQKTYGGVGNDGLVGVTKALDGNYLLSGWYNYNATNTKPWLIKVNNTGAVIWNKLYGGSQSHGLFTYSVQLSDSTIALIGGIKDTVGVPYAGLIMKIKANGDSIWARKYKRATTQDDYIYNFAPTNDGGFILVGTVPGQATPSGTQDGWLIKTDCLGADSITHYFGNSCYNGSPTGIKEITITPWRDDAPNLMDNYPNPFNESTVIPYYLPEQTKFGFIIISDITGRVIKQFNLNSGINSIELKTADLSSGIYYYSMYVDGNMHSCKKMILIK